jgi:hypothetical protein
MSHKVAIIGSECIYPDGNSVTRAMTVDLHVCVDGRAEMPPRDEAIRAEADKLIRVVARGWEKGVFQAYSNAKQDLNRLQEIIDTDGEN